MPQKKQEISSLLPHLTSVLIYAMFALLDFGLGLVSRLDALILVPTSRGVNPYRCYLDAVFDRFCYHLECGHNQGATRQKYSAYGHELRLDGPTLDVMPRSKDIERSG